MNYYSLTWYRKDGTGQTGAQCSANDAKEALRKLKAMCLDNTHFPKSAAGEWTLSIINQFNQQIPIQ